MIKKIDAHREQSGGEVLAVDLVIAIAGHFRT